VRVSSIRWGIIWIGIGLFFLAINLELLDSLVFPRLFSLWPILLVAIGVELIFRRTRFYFLALLSPLLIAGAFIVAATAKGDWGWSSDEFWHRWVWKANERKVDNIEIASDSTVTSLAIDLECGPSNITLRPVSDHLFKATTEYYKRSPWIEHRIENGIEKINYSNREKTRLSLLGLNIAASRSDFEIADNLPIKAAIKATDDQPMLDFSRFQLKSLDLDIRSNKTTLYFGNRQDTVDVIISGRAELLSLQFPQNYKMIINGDSTRLAGILDRAKFNIKGREFVSNSGELSHILRLNLHANIKKLELLPD
jgi:hypothetical protein